MDTPIPHMRLLKEAAAEIKNIDPNTAVTTYIIRQLAVEGKIKSVMAGRKRLINFDSLLEYLDNQRETVQMGTIRKIT
jgi:excisionase family DNA binding protein